MKRLVLTGLCVLIVTTVSASAAPIVPDNGSGTADMPLHLDYLSQSPMYIIAGLPPGTDIAIDIIHTAPTTTVEEAGGSLSGTRSAGIGSGLSWSMTGSGVLAGYSRSIFMPLSFNVTSFPAPPGAGYEVHTAPRTLGAPVQSFDTDMFRMYSQIIGDPDFDLLRVTAGTDFGLPSPGHTTLTQLSGGNWAVDSLFDITFRIDFIGASGGPMEGMSGSTTGTIEMTAVPEPATICLFILGGLAAMRRRRA